MANVLKMKGNSGFEIPSTSLGGGFDGEPCPVLPSVERMMVQIFPLLHGFNLHVQFQLESSLPRNHPYFSDRSSDEQININIHVESMDDVPPLLIDMLRDRDMFCFKHLKKSIPSLSPSVADKYQAYLATLPKEGETQTEKEDRTPKEVSLDDEILPF